jgi:hypothetical protein
MIQPDFSQNQPAAITLNIGSPGTLDTYSRQHKEIGNLGVQRAWSEIMNVLANMKGSVGRWNLNFWRLEHLFIYLFLKQGCCRHLF